MKKASPFHPDFFQNSNTGSEEKCFKIILKINSLWEYFSLKLKLKWEVVSQTTMTTSWFLATIISRVSPKIFWGLSENFSEDFFWNSYEFSPEFFSRSLSGNPLKVTRAVLFQFCFSKIFSRTSSKFPPGRIFQGYFLKKICSKNRSEDGTGFVLKDFVK